MNKKHKINLKIVDIVTARYRVSFIVYRFRIIIILA